MLIAFLGLLPSTTVEAQCVYDGYGSIVVTSPRAGQTFVRGDRMTIQWSVGYYDSYGTNTFNIDYSEDGGATWKTIEQAIDKNTYSYNWTVPLGSTPGTRWTIRVSESPDNYWWGCALNYPGQTGSFTVNKGCFPPVFSVQPQNRSVCGGVPVSFSVATDAENPTYEWMKDGNLVARTTSSVYTIASPTKANEGVYSVRVIDQCGAQSGSNGAVLTIFETPTILTNPAPTLVLCENAVGTLTVSASGAGRRFQWRLNGTNIPGATDSTYTIANALVSLAGIYDCVVSGTCTPAAISAGCTVSVVTKPRITQDLAPAAMCPGSNATLSVGATGQSLVYTWFKNGQEIPNVAGPTLTLSNVTAADDGVYVVRVLSNVPNPNRCQVDAFTREVNVSVYKAPSIEAHPPATVDACVGAELALTANIIGSDQRFQWFRNGVAIPGATLQTYSVQRASAADAGSYTMRATTTCGLTATTAASVVSVLSQPTMSVQPTNQTLTIGETLTLIADASDARSYQWMKNNQPIAGATSSIFSIASVRLADAGSYNCIIRNGCGGVVSRYARVSVKDPSLDVPELSLSDDAIDLGEIPIGYSATRTMTGFIRNTGAAPMNVISVSGTGTGFTVTTTPTPFTLAPGASADVSIMSMPSALGAAMGQIDVVTNAPSPSASAVLSSTSVLRYSVPTSIVFEDTDIADLVGNPGPGKDGDDVQASARLCVDVANTSAVPVTLDATTLSGAHAADFSVETTLPVNIAPGATSQLCIVFNPSSTGGRYATLNIQSSTGGNTTAQLSGNGTTEVSVDDELATLGVAVFPNPATDGVVIQLASPARGVEIVDVNGRVVASFASPSTILRWNMTDNAGNGVASGQYVVRVRTMSEVKGIPLSIVR